MSVAIHAAVSAVGLFCWIRYWKAGILHLPAGNLPAGRFQPYEHLAAMLIVVLLGFVVGAGAGRYGPEIANAVFAGSAAVLASGFLILDRRALLAVRWREDLQLAGLATLLVFPLIAGAAILGSLVFGTTQEAAVKLLLECPPHLRVLLVFSGTILTPIAEEAVFRGMLYRAMKGFFPRAGVTVVIAAAVVFAAIHLFPAGLLALTILGIAASLLVERTGRLAPAILLHAMFNGLQMVAILLGNP